jgi:hypothetical protein
MKGRAASIVRRQRTGTGNRIAPLPIRRGRDRAAKDRSLVGFLPDLGGNNGYRRSCDLQLWGHASSHLCEGALSRLQQSVAAAARLGSGPAGSPHRLVIGPFSSTNKKVHGHGHFNSRATVGLPYLRQLRFLSRPSSADGSSRARVLSRRVSLHGFSIPTIRGRLGLGLTTVARAKGKPWAGGRSLRDTAPPGGSEFPRAAACFGTDRERQTRYSQCAIRMTRNG